MSNSSWPNGLQHARHPSPSQTPGACLNSFTVSWWCHQPSHPLSSLHLLPSIFPSIRVFSNESVLCNTWPKCWCFSLASVFPMNTQDWFPLGLTGLNSLQSKGFSRVFSNSTVLCINSSVLSFPYGPTLTSTQDCRKAIVFTRWTFVGKVMSLLFNMLSRLATTFLSRRKRLLISLL